LTLSRFSVSDSPEVHIGGKSPILPIVERTEIVFSSLREALIEASVTWAGIE